jgi:hypothetical protein
VVLSVPAIFSFSERFAIPSNRPCPDNSAIEAGSRRAIGARQAASWNRSLAACVISATRRKNDMRIQTLAGIAILAALAFPVSAMADETGSVGGAVAGAVVGGPVGAVVGGVVGNSMTNHRYHHRDYAQRHPYYRD